MEMLQAKFHDSYLGEICVLASPTYINAASVDRLGQLQGTVAIEVMTLAVEECHRISILGELSLRP